MSKIKEIMDAVENGKLKLIEGLVAEALDENIDPAIILNDGMIVAMGSVGTKFQNNEIFVPEMLIAAKTMKKGVEILRPHLASDALGKRGKCIIGTVVGDMHDIGKNLVALMVEAAGFEIIDLGVDIPAEKFVEAVKSNPDCNIVAASALLTTTMEALKDTVGALIDAGCKEQAKIIVGGAPITQRFADEIGADGYAADAGAAAVKVLELLE
jgi:corrinoid protein of di/trimethylamine methyltransferase